MREILFRGKRVDNGELVVGNSVLFFKDTTKIYMEVIGNIYDSPELLRSKNG